MTTEPTTPSTYYAETALGSLICERNDHTGPLCDGCRAMAAHLIASGYTLDAARRPPEREALAAILHTEASERVLGKFGVGLALEWADAVRELVAALPQPVPTDR